MGDENLADSLGLAALDQAADVLANVRQRLLETLTLDGGGFSAQRVIDGLQHLDMRRADGDSRGGGNGLHQAAGCRGEQHLGHLDNLFTRLAHRWQRLDLFTETFFDGGQQDGQGIGSDAWLGDDFQHLAATGAEAEQLAQALDRHRAVLAIDNAHTNLAFKTFRQLRQDFRRTGMQAVGVGQRNTRARPIGGQFTTQHFKHGAATGGTAQFMAATFYQQRTQALEQRLVGLAKTGQTK
ncbi:hypothetical protein D3C76_1014310 [compost metagenome]